MNLRNNIFFLLFFDKLNAVRVEGSESAIFWDWFRNRKHRVISREEGVVMMTAAARIFRLRESRVEAHRLRRPSLEPRRGGLVVPK